MSQLAPCIDRNHAAKQEKEKYHELLSSVGNNYMKSLFMEMGYGSKRGVGEDNLSVSLQNDIGQDLFD